MRRFYLDTNVFAYLTDPSGRHSPLAQRIKLLVRARAVEIVGSFELLGEFVPRASSDPDRHEYRLEFFWMVCGTRILRPWNELIRKEIEKGARLSLREAYVDLETVHAVHHLSYDHSAYEEWAQGVRKRKAEYVHAMTEAANKVEEDAALALAKQIKKDGASELAKEGKEAAPDHTDKTVEKVPTKKQVVRAVRKAAGKMNISRELVVDWVRELLIRPNQSRFSLSSDEDTWPDPSALPCTSSYMAMTAALRRKCHEARRRDRGSDNYDTMHYVLGAMGDGLVTEDKGLHSATGLIEWNPVRVLTLEEFELLLRRL